MQVRAEDEDSVLTLGSTLAAFDAERAAEMVQSVAPFSHLVVDFTAVRECHDTAFLYLIDALKQLVDVTDVTVDLHGITCHQKRLLKYLGHGRGSRMVSPMAPDRLGCPADRCGN